MSHFTQLILVALTLFSGSVTASDEPPHSAQDLAANVKEIFRTRCFECHGSSRQEAGIHILDTSTYVGENDYVTPGDVDLSSLLDVISADDEDVRMPESPLPPLEPFEINTIRDWIKSGATEFPDDVPNDPIGEPTKVGTEYVLSEMAAYLSKTDRDDRKYLRFFSSNHLLAAGATPQELQTQRNALAKAINHLSWERSLVAPIVVDEPIGSVLAVDIRQLGWNATPFQTVEHGRGTESSQVNLYDLVLLEYPYSVATENSEAWQELSESYFNQAEMARPIPFVRTDWLASVATQSPLYEDILMLPRSLHELENELGVDSERNIETGRAKRAGMTVSGVSRNNRVVERHPARYGAYWKSYDFETSRGQQNMFIDPMNFHFAGGEMIWSLPNGLQGYLITDSSGNRIDEAPTSIVTDKFAEDKVVRNGLNCIRCHDRGMKRFSDNIRPAFENLPRSARHDFDQVMGIYVDRESMDNLVQEDEQRFVTAMQAITNHSQHGEPLVPVTRRFLEVPITLSQASGELGLQDSEVLRQIFKLPEFTRLGLASLYSGGVVRRDTWEDYYDRIATKLGAGTPIVPTDGLRKRDHLSDGLSSRLRLTTNKSGNTFSAGDKLVITISNETGRDQFIELIGTDTHGKIAVLTKVLPLPSGTSYRFPQTESVKIRAQLGKEHITVFAGHEKFSPGVLLRGERVADRFVHNHYHLDQSKIRQLPTGWIKKTITIETR